jgi:hypothetical protein
MVGFVGQRPVSGNRLTFLRTELTISGKQMTGTGPDIKITLTKDK